MEIKKLTKYAEDKLLKLGAKKFKRLMGVDKNVFDKAVDAEEQARAQRHKKGGKPNAFTCYESVVILLLYLKRYIPMEDMAFEYEVSKSVICTTIHQAIKDLLNNKNFTLFGADYIKYDNSEDRQIDVTEVRIERPKYNQKSKYSGKKKYHTMKIQIIRGVNTGFIYEIQIGLGAEHDFHLFKRTFTGSPENDYFEVDLGYVGIDKIHEKCLIPTKNSKSHKLTEEEKELNKLIAADRIFIEHTNSWIKRFKILSTKFRNKLSYFAPISVLLCGFYNFDIA